MADDTVPSGTFGDYGPERTDLGEVPSNYEICDRSGFKVPAGELVEQWDGLKVRARDRDYRHPQEFVRVRAERPNPSRSPEPDDEFLGTNEVTASGL